MTTVLLLALLTTPVAPPAGALCAPASVGYLGPRYPSAVFICRRRVTTTMRRTILAAYGIPWGQRGLYEIDHFLPLCLGGSNDLANTWPQPWKSARLCRQLREGRTTQAAAVEEIRRWR